MKPRRPGVPVSTMLADGAGGLRFQALAPPGLGRLVRIPFYYDAAQAAVPGFHALSEQVLVANLTAAGTTRSDTHPVIGFRAPTNAAVLGVTPFLSGEPVLRTNRVRWATVRIVGFEAKVYRQLALVRDAFMELSVKELHVRGGSTLFSHDEYMPSAVYASGSALVGLRDYPILKGTNRAEVTVQTMGTAATLADLTQLAMFSMFSLSVVCDVLLDDNFGAHVPGPYARKGALVHRGGSEGAALTLKPYPGYDRGRGGLS